jgi:hypothetical protein
MSRAVFTPSRRHVPSALNLLLVLGALLLAAALGAPPAAAQANTANRTVFSDDFSSPGRWLLPAEADGAVSFGKGRLTLHSRPDSSNAVVVAHKLLLSPAASYRVSTEITVTERHNEDALAGISLQSPAGDVVRVRLRPGSKLVWIAYLHNEQAQPHLMPGTEVAGLKTGPGDSNTLAVESSGGRFTVLVNGVTVGTSAVVDFTPTRVQLVASDLRAEFAKLTVSETGLDTRHARLLQRLPVPGQRTLAQDTLKGAGLGKALSFLGVGKAPEEPEWTAPFNDEDGRFERDTGRGRLLLEAKTPKRSASVRVSSYVPLPGVGYAVSARVHLLREGDEDDCAGVFVDNKPLANGDFDMLVACVNSVSVALWHFDAKADAWKNLAEAALAVPPATQGAAMDLRLVMTAQRVIAFVDGRVHVSAARPADFKYDGVGLRVDPGYMIEVSDFKAHEL